MAFCDCSVGGHNLGQSPCDPILASANKILFKSKLDANGDIAGIDFASGNAPFDASFWADYLQASPLRNRYLLGADVDDYGFEMNDSERVETANKVSYEVHKGHIDVTYNVYTPKGASTKLFQKYKSLECGNLGINIIDDKGQVAGVQDGDIMRLIPIDSLEVKFAPTQNSGTVSHLIIMFRIPLTFDFGTVRLFQFGSADLNPLDMMPIVDVVGSDLAGTNSSAVMTLKVGFDSAKFGFDPFTGLLATNFTATRGGSPIVVSSIVETADGEYSLTLASANTTADVMVVNLVANGYEMNALTVTI
jgi:hypothetical protein